MDEREASQRLGMRPEGLRGLRRRGEGPAHIRVGRLVRYRGEDLEAWIETRRSDKQHDPGVLEDGTGSATTRGG
jgi:predicted DNA-binding transcriptional regulator AlpA